MHSLLCAVFVVPEVCRPEPLPPLCHAVRLIHTHQRQWSQSPQAGQHWASWQLLRSYVQQAQLTRLSTIKEADEILIMEGGKIIERGNHYELLNSKDSVYKRLNMMQELVQ